MDGLSLLRITKCERLRSRIRSQQPGHVSGMHTRIKIYHQFMRAIWLLLVVLTLYSIL